MSRRAFQPGEAGEITATPLRRTETGGWKTLPNGRTKPDAWRARCRYRDWTGEIGTVSRRGATRPLAVAAVEQELRDRLAGDSAHWTGSTLLVDACRQWLDDDSHGLSPSTVDAYRGAFKRAIEHEDSPVRSLTLAQANDVQRLRRFLQHVADTRGISSMRHVKAVMSNVLDRATSYGVLVSNGIRQVGRVTTTRPKVATTKDTSRAFTDTERDAVLRWADEWAATPALHVATERKRQALADLVAFLAGTGARVGEALSVRWEHVDLETGRTFIPGTKSTSAARVVTLPEWLRERLRERQGRSGSSGLIFHAPRLHDSEARWDASNCSNAVADLLARAGYPWARSHSFRKTVATRLATAGVPVQQIADHLGHADPSMTMSVYLGRDFMGDKADLADHL